jgi:hypothetical protein
MLASICRLVLVDDLDTSYYEQTGNLSIINGKE